MRGEIFVLVVFLASAALGADHETFKNCSRTFCNNLRNLILDPDDYYQAIYEDITDQNFIFNLTTRNSDHILTLTLSSSYDFDSHLIYRVEIEDPFNPAYKLNQVLREELLSKERQLNSPKPQFKIERTEEKLIVRDYQETSGFDFYFGPPFMVGFYLHKDGDISLEPKIRLNGSSLTYQEETGNFAFDLIFPDSEVFYGLFHHADSLVLRETADGSVDPYRLKNSDTFEYEVNSTMALYGSIPALYAHSTRWTGGVFLHNAAEQWVDIHYGDDAITARFMVEAGSFDLFALLGSNPSTALQQYEYLTGVAHLPQLWTLGYHQCRWTYWTQEDVVDVVENMDAYDFPIDAVWLDDGYSDGNKYFVWNPENFSDPIGLQEKINETNRKLVVIADPHVKVDTGYSVYSQARQLGLFVKFPNGTDYEGDSWPGASSYLDFMNDATTEFYADLYSYENFAQSTPVIAGIWNDMNEPSVFDDSNEKTFPSDLVHYGGITHKNIHNIYGLQQTRATHLGLLRRDNGATRPFILSRSTFAGSQRYAAMWTGDNTATWDHLSVTYSECLTANIFGQVWCGADVGGFHNVPEDALVARWYQSATWLPFFRGHSEARIDPEPPRQEPYEYPENIRNIIREAIRIRYKHIPQWYALFYEHTRHGSPVIRPLFYQYPEDERVYSIDQQLLLGRDILVRQIAEPDVTSVSVYLPGADTYWLQANDNTLHQGGRWINVNVDETFIPVYYRYGGIIVRKDTPRPTTKDMENDSYDIYVYLNTNQIANGFLYYDDYTSFKYRDNKEYGYFLIEFDGVTDDLTFTAIDSDATPPGPAYVASLTIYRIPTTSSPGAPVVEKVITHTADGNLLRNIDISKEARGTNKLRMKI